MNPPSCDAAKSMFSLLATSMRCAADSFVHVIVAPALCAMRSASRLTDTGSAMRAFGTVSATSRTSTSSACSDVSGVPRSSTIVARLAVGVEHEPEIGARRAHEVTDRLQARLEVVAVATDARGRRVRVHAEHRRADLRQARSA